MSIIKDIMDTLKDIDNNATADQFVKNKRYSSISNRAQEGTLQFPCLVSRTLDIKSAQMITKSLERNFASFVMIATTLSPSITVRNDKTDITDYIRKFHQNMDGKYGAQGFINDIITLAREHSEFIPGEKAGLLFTACEGATGNLVKDNKNQFGSIYDSIRTDILNEKYVPKKNYLGIVREAKNTINNNPTFNNTPDISPTFNNNPTINNSPTIENNPDNSSQSTINLTIGSGTFNGQRQQGGATEIVTKNILRDNDVKKANELIPTTLHLKVLPVNEHGDAQGTVDFLVGIKATMHAVDSDNMITEVIGACRNKNKLFKFIKWRTGEISFAKDLLLNINSIQQDIARRSNGNSPWFLALKRRARISKIKQLSSLPTGMLPNATFVITIEEVELIKQQYGFDLLNPVFVDKIMQEYFLLSFVIVDVPSEVAYFLFDGHKEFETVSFDGLERENSNNKGIDAKDVVKMMNRI